MLREPHKPGALNQKLNGSAAALRPRLELF
jgi:hypothetical protein